MSDKNVSVYLQPNYTGYDDLYTNDISCGCISIDDASQYMKKVAMQKPSNPYCMQYIECVLGTCIYDDCPGNELTLMIHVVPNGGCRNVANWEKKGKDMYACEQCAANIASGKCKDPLVIEQIGKVFFQKKYEKQR